MPIYAFKCDKCGHEFEELVSRMSATAPCPKCSSAKVSKMLTAPADYRGGGDNACGEACSVPYAQGGGGGCCCGGGGCSHGH